MLGLIESSGTTPTTATIAVSTHGVSRVRVGHMAWTKDDSGTQAIGLGLVRRWVSDSGGGGSQMRCTNASDLFGGDGSQTRCTNANGWVLLRRWISNSGGDGYQTRCTDANGLVLVRRWVSDSGGDGSQTRCTDANGLVLVRR